MLNGEKYKDELENLENRSSLVCFIAKEKVGLRCDVGYCLKCEKEAFKWLLEEYKEPILTDKEKAYLKSVIEPKKEEIVCVEKYWLASDNDGNVFYVVRVLQKDPIFNGSDRMLLYFLTTEDMPFKGMELRKKYTLEELGL